MTRSSQPGSGSVIHLWLAGRSGPRGAEDGVPARHRPTRSCLPWAPSEPASWVCLWQPAFWEGALG